MRLNRSLSVRLSFYIVLATGVLFILLLFQMGIAGRNFIRQEATNTANTTLDGAISDMEAAMTDVEAALNSQIWVVKEHLSDPDYMYTVTRNLVDYNPLIVGSAVAFEPYYYPSKGEYYSPYSSTDPQSGKTVSKQLGSNDYDYFTAEWYQVPKLLMANRWSEPYFDEGGGNVMMITYSVPLWNEDGVCFAVMTADVSLSSITDRLSEVHPYENSYPFMLGNSGAYVAHPEEAKTQHETIFTAAIASGDKDVFELGRKMLAGESGNSEIEIEKERYLVTYGPLYNGWSVAIVSPSNDVFAGLKKMNFPMLGGVLLGLLILYFLVRFIIGRTTQPIAEFSYSALSVAKGNFKARIPEVQTHDELKQLETSLHYMLRSFDEYIRELKSSTAANERFESELNIASKIQYGMLPRDFPKDDRVDLYAMLQPAKEVGGDLYVFELSGNHLYFSVGDVYGKGVPASLYMALTRAAFKLLSNMQLTVPQVVAKINDAFAEGNRSNMFVTLFFASLNLDTMEMEYCNAGHNPIVYIDEAGKSQFLPAKPNIACGVFEGFEYQGETAKLSKGSRLVLYTDGVTEAEASDKSQYGEERLLQFASSRPVSESSEKFVSGLLDSVREFTAGNDQNDDITIMSIKFQ